MNEFFSVIAEWAGHAGDSLKHLADSSFWLHLLHEYKYWVVILGALLEGEMVLLLAGGSAYHGYMNVHWVMFIAFLGALLHDHLLFFLGRTFGKKLIHRSPRLHGHMSKVSNLIRKYDNLFIMGFRFVYGLRTITPFIIGHSKISWKRYSLLVSVSGAIWATVVSYVGFSCAMALDTIMQDFDRYKKYLAIGIVILITLIVGIIKYRNFSSKPKT